MRSVADLGELAEAAGMAPAFSRTAALVVAVLVCGGVAAAAIVFRRVERPPDAPAVPNPDPAPAAKSAPNTEPVKPLPAAQPETTPPSPERKVPKHLEISLKLVGDMKPASGGDAEGSAQGETDERGAENRSGCSAFLCEVLSKAYGIGHNDFKRWFGYQSPSAACYYDAIVKGAKFDRIEKISDIRPGDIVAIKYPASHESSGHVMIAASEPVERRATDPVVKGTVQYEIEVIDSSRSGHGPRDSRWMPEKKAWNAGAGRGIFRIYAAPDGTVAGYTWSTSRKSHYYPTSERPLAVGRISLERKPKRR